MSDFNDLKKENQSADRLEAVYQKVEPQKKVARKKPTVFSVIFATIKRDKDFFERSDDKSRLPVLNATVLTSLLLLAVSVIIVLGYFFLDKMVLVPMLIIFCPLVIPLIILVFNYEMNDDKGITLFRISLTVAVGLIFYFIVTLINERIFYNISFYANVESYVYPVLYTILLFLLSLLIATSFKATKLSAYFLIAVTLSLTFYYIGAVNGLFSDLFVSDESVEFFNGVNHPLAIINNDVYLTQSIANVFDNWFFDYVFIPLMYSFWAIIIGSVVSVAAERRSQNRSLSRSTYLLFLLVIFLQYLVYISTSIALLDITLEIISFLVSAYVAVSMLNTRLNK